MPKMTATETARLTVKFERMPFKKLRKKLAVVQTNKENLRKLELFHRQERLSYDNVPNCNEPPVQGWRAQARQNELDERRQRMYWTARLVLLEEVFDRRRLAEENHEYVCQRRPKKIRPRRFRPQTKFWKRTRRA